MDGQAATTPRCAAGGDGTGGGAAAGRVRRRRQRRRADSRGRRPRRRRPAAAEAGRGRRPRARRRGQAAGRSRTCGSTSGRSSTPERCGCRWTMWTRRPARPTAVGHRGRRLRRRRPAAQRLGADARGGAGAAGAGGEVHRAWWRRWPKLGRQQSREIDTQDVTEETVDLDARITSQRARVESARRLLARATSITDLVSLENELGRREADLASLEAKKRRLADLTALSTITVSLAGPAAKATEEEAETGFLVGLQGRLEGVRRLDDRPAHRAGRVAALAGGARRTAGGAAGGAAPAAARPRPWSRRSARRRQCPQRGLHHDADADRDGPLVHVEARPVQVDVGAGATRRRAGRGRRGRTPGTRRSPRRPCSAVSRRSRPGRARRRWRRSAPGWLGRRCITGGRPRRYSRSTVAPVGGDHVPDHLSDDLGGLLPGVAVHHPEGAGGARLGRDDVVAGAGRGVAEDQQQAAVGRHPAADQGRHLGDQPAERVDQVDGQVRAGGVPARAGEPDGRRCRRPR